MSDNQDPNNQDSNNQDSNNQDPNNQDPNNQDRNNEGLAGPAARGPSRKAGTGRMRTALLAACALIGGGIGGTGAYAVAAGPWHHGFPIERVQTVVLHALDGVGATTAQEAKVHDIIATSFSTVGSDSEARRAAGRQMLSLLRAPSIDRSAVERVRAEQIAAFDQRTKTLVGALLDAADQLTPDQRGKLADRVEGMMQHHQDMMRQHDDRHRDGGPDGDGYRREGAPDSGPGKG